MRNFFFERRWCGGGNIAKKGAWNLFAISIKCQARNERERGRYGRFFGLVK